MIGRRRDDVMHKGVILEAAWPPGGRLQPSSGGDGRFVRVLAGPEGFTAYVGNPDIEELGRHRDLSTLLLGLGGFVRQANYDATRTRGLRPIKRPLSQRFGNSLAVADQQVLLFQAGFREAIELIDLDLHGIVMQVVLASDRIILVSRTTDEPVGSLGRWECADGPPLTDRRPDQPEMSRKLAEKLGELAILDCAIRAALSQESSPRIATGEVDREDGALLPDPPCP